MRIIQDGKKSSLIRSDAYFPVWKSAFKKISIRSDRTGLFSTLYYPHCLTKKNWKYFNSLSFGLRITGLKWNRKLVPTAHARSRFCSNPVRSGGIFIYSRSARRISFEISCFKVHLKRNSSGRTRIYEYSPPPPQINALVSALNGTHSVCAWCSTIFRLSSSPLQGKVGTIAAFQMWREKIVKCDVQNLSNVTCKICCWEGKIRQWILARLVFFASKFKRTCSRPRYHCAAVHTLDDKSLKPPPWYCVIHSGNLGHNIYFFFTLFSRF